MRKYLKYFGVVAVLALGIWCGTRWNVWFGNPEELPYQPSAAPSRVLLTFGDSCATSRNVSWTCDSVMKPSFLEVYDETADSAFKIKASGEVFRSRAGVAAYYVAKLRGLSVGHSYRYMAVTDTMRSPEYRFRVEDPTETAFLYVGDVQDTLGGIANVLLKEACRKNPDAQFLVCGGDLTERPMDSYWRETFCTLDSIGQSMPVMTTTGNHDYLKKIIRKLERRFSLVHSYFLDSMVGENQVFTLVHGDVQFFLLDSNREFFYLFTQRAWLKEKLQKSTAKWKIVVSHHPLHSVRGKKNLVQRWMFDDLVKEYDVTLLLHGHEHAYARMTNEGKTPVYTVSHCSPKNYKIKPGDKFDKALNNSRYYQKVRTHGDTLFVSAYDAVSGARVDSVQIFKNGTVHEKK